jgi:hypothetical protein
VGAHPDADAAGDFAAADAFAETLGEGHGESLARVGKSEPQRSQRRGESTEREADPFHD